MGLAAGALLGSGAVGLTLGLLLFGFGLWLVGLAARSGSRGARRLAGGAQQTTEQSTAFRLTATCRRLLELRSR